MSLSPRVSCGAWFAAASASEGLIVPGPGIARVQLRTRHAVLLDPEALDMLTYAIEAAPKFAISLGEVYGIDFFDPPPRARHRAVVPEQAVRAIWAKRSERAWSAVRARFGISGVLVKKKTGRFSSPRWRATSSSLLYRIPE